MFPELNFSESPFYSYRLGNYTLFKCPSARRTSNSIGYMLPVPCLSNSSNHVYAVSANYNLCYGPLFLCTKMFTAPSLSSMSFGGEFEPTALRWDEPSCGKCEAEGERCGFMNGSRVPNECFPKEKVPDARKGKAIKGVTISLSSLCLFCILAYYIYHLKKKKQDQEKIENFLEDYKALKPTRYTYADIKKITDQFKEKLGQGGYGTVYKGKLSGDVTVAVKLLDHIKGTGEEFINEVGTIGRIHHVNVVRLVGYCADGCRRGLVYEFLPNESLEKFISSGKQKLSWEKLQQIAIGVAKGLHYLHQGCSQRILHFDIKPHNILLDHNFNPKVADFGLAKLCSKEQSIVSMTAARGTIGYIAPEVFSRNYGNVSYKADIYSFGMMLLDMVGGRKKFHSAMNDDDSEVYFPEWLYNQLEKGEEISIQIDEERDNKIVKKLTIVGLWCIQWCPADRPSMKVVLQMIEGDDEIPKMPPNPFASGKTSTTNAGPSFSNFCNALEIISEED